MRIYYHYLGIDNEVVPKDVTHVMVDKSVTRIKREAFLDCVFLVSAIMGDNVTEIEQFAFLRCCSLKILRLSKSLKRIGKMAFGDCRSIKNLFLPPTVARIDGWAFSGCESMTLLILTNEINIDESQCDQIFCETAISATAKESGDQFIDYLHHQLDDSPFHQVCSKMDVNALQINKYLDAKGNASARKIDSNHRMTPLHVLAMNPFAEANLISGTILQANMNAICCKDCDGKTPLDYARQYNVPGMLAMIEALCMNQ